MPPKKNIVVSNTSGYLLCDFGLSRIKHELSLTSKATCQDGHYRFVAPEMPFGELESRLDQRPDIYSLAMTVYTLGRTPLQRYDRAWRMSRGSQREGPPKHDSLAGPTIELAKPL